jgi:hypothetical protein
VRPERFELPTFWFVVKRYECILLSLRGTQCGLERRVRLSRQLIGWVFGWAKKGKSSHDRIGTSLLVSITQAIPFQSVLAGAIASAYAVFRGDLEFVPWTGETQRAVGRAQQHTEGEHMQRKKAWASSFSVIDSARSAP